MAGGALGFCCSSEGKSDEMIKHGDLRREDTADLRCVRRDDGPDRTVRAAILGFKGRKYDGGATWMDAYRHVRPSSVLQMSSSVRPSAVF